MLSKATSSLPYSSPSHFDCRSDPPKWKSDLMLKRTIRHNIIEIRKRVCFRVNFNKYQNKVYKILFWVLLLAYPSTSTRTLRVFQCEPIGKSFFLARDYTQKCFEGIWWFWSTWATVCVFIYVIGIPLLFFLLLYNASHMHVQEKWEECKRSEKRKKRLIKEAEADAQIGGRFFHRPTNIHEEEHCVKQYLRIANLSHHKVLDRLGFIYDAYNNDSWWWEIVELLRKMMMNGVMCLLLPDSPTQIMVGMVITFLFMTITLQQQPYKCNSDHNLAFFCHLQLFITLFGGFITREKIPFLGTMDVDQTLEPQVVGLIVVLSHAAVIFGGLLSIVLERFFSDEQIRLKRAIMKNESMRKKVLSKANRGFAMARKAAKEEIAIKNKTGSRGLANSLAKKLEGDKARKERLGGFGIHSLVGEEHGAMDKALGKFEKNLKKTKVAPSPTPAGGRALNWSAGGNTGADASNSAPPGPPTDTPPSKELPIATSPTSATVPVKQDFSFGENDENSADSESSSGGSSSSGSEASSSDSSVDSGSEHHSED